VSDPLYTVGVQISDELVAVFHHGQLLLDIDGRPLLAQFNFPGAFHRLECHHHLHHPRMGYVFYYYVDENLISLALVGLYRICMGGRVDVCQVKHSRNVHHTIIQGCICMINPFKFD
jgi:hypothetical protein